MVLGLQEQMSISMRNAPLGQICGGAMTQVIFTGLLFAGHSMGNFHMGFPSTDFFALNGMPARTNDEKGVCLSVRLSVKRVHCDKTEERSVHVFIPYERSFSVVFWEEEWLVGSNPFYWNFGSTGPRWNEIADLEPMLTRSASAVTPSEKS